MCALATQGPPHENSPFLAGAAFGPEDIEIMDQAFATAALVLGLPSDDDERAQEVVRTVIEFATAGELDLVTLTDRVVQCELQRAQPGARARSSILQDWPLFSSGLPERDRSASSSSLSSSASLSGSGPFGGS
jgi:hypothetical protein